MKLLADDLTHLYVTQPVRRSRLYTTESKRNIKLSKKYLIICGLGGFVIDGYYWISVAEGLVLVRVTFVMRNVDSVFWLQDVPIPVTAWVCRRSLVGIAGSNSAGAWISLSFECCVLSGRGLCDGPIPHPEKSYRSACVLQVWSMQQWTLHLQGIGKQKSRLRKKERKKERKLQYVW